MIENYFNEKRNLINASLKKLLPDINQMPSLIHEAMHYSVFAGGKRLRPILVLAVGETLQIEEDFLLEPACALEFIHTYSLIHDDLPCIDNDDLRRGKPTSHKVFGEAIAVLAGDALLSHAFHILSNSKIAKEKPHIGMEIIFQISEAICTGGMLGGQVLDILYENKKITQDEAFQVDLLKTAKLIKTSVIIPAIIAGSKEKMQLLEQYGENIGIAFQIIDDLLDIKGEEKKLGKSIGKDLKAKKATLPSLLGYDKAFELARNYVQQAISIISKIDSKYLLTNIAQFILSRHS